MKKEGFFPSILWPTNWKNQATAKIAADICHPEPVSATASFPIKDAMDKGPARVRIASREELKIEVNKYK